MHRLSLVAAVLLALIAGSIGAVAAQESTPVSGDSPFAALNAQPLDLTVTEDGSVELPAELAAGRYEVTLDNPTDRYVDLVFVMSATGGGTEELQGIAVDEALGVPGWFFDATLAGGISAAAQSTASAVVELTPAGAWTVWVSSQSVEEGGAPSESLSPLTVTGDATPVAEAQPTEGDALTVDMFDYDFSVPEGLVAGEQVWQLTNSGEHPHHLVLFRSEDPITEGRVLQALQIEYGVPGDNGTPEATGPQDAGAPIAMEEVAFGQVISPGRTEWISVNLEPGYYVLVCFVPDAESGLPHALLRMIEVIEIGGNDTPGVATPAS